MEEKWVICPVCKSKTRVKLRDDTILKNFPLFVYETCGSVNSLSAQRKATAAALKTAEKQLEISRALLEEGRINETALMEAKNNVLKLKAELAGGEAEIMCKKFAVENKIESFGY